MTEQELDTILARIAKLQKLAERGGTPEEAAVAASKMQELMFKYNISHARLELERGQDLTGFGHKERSGIKAGSWRQRLVSDIARANFCRIVLVGRGTAVDVIGHRDSVQLVYDLYDWLQGQVYEMGWRERERYQQSGEMDVSRGRGWTDTFRRGCVDTINRRLRQQREDDEAKARQQGQSGTTSLMVIETIEQHVNTTVTKLYPNLTSSRSRGGLVGGMDAYQAGKAAGHRIPLERRQNLGGGRPKLS